MYNISKVTQKDQTEAVALIAEYIYRPDGLRHSKSVTKNGITLTHTHIWDGANIVAEIGATGAIVARYLRGLSLIAREQDGACQYYFHNAHGDVVQRIDARGNLLKNYDYDAFGNEQNPVEEDSNPFRYCSEYWDKETETIYLRARNYDPKNGRFGAEDPIRAGGNWYDYCGGNPIKMTDPSGLKAKNKTSNLPSPGASWIDRIMTDRGRKKEEKGTSLKFNEGTDFKTSGSMPLNILPAEYGKPRNAKDYRTLLSSFGVEEMPGYGDYTRYWDESTGRTYCNIYMWDVTMAAGCEIPHYYDQVGNPAQRGDEGAWEADANDMIRLWLQPEKDGWKEVTAEEAIARANAGYPTVATWYNPGGIGHVAMVSPQKSGDTGVMIAQSGGTNFEYGTLEQGFGSGKPVKYYTHD